MDEPDLRRATGQDTASLDEWITSLEMAEQMFDDIKIIRAIHAMIERHGPGPWPTNDIAALAGLNIGDVRRVLKQMPTADFAMPSNEPPDVRDQAR